MIEIIENSIKIKLLETFKNYEVESFPADFENFKFFSHNGCFLVRYEGSKMAEQHTVVAVKEDETYNFTVFMALRYLKRHEEAYEKIKDLKKALNGLPILNKRLRITSINYEDVIDGDFWYSTGLTITFPLSDNYSDLSECSEIIGKVQSIKQAI